MLPKGNSSAMVVRVTPKLFGNEHYATAEGWRFVFMESKKVKDYFEPFLAYRKAKYSASIYRQYHRFIYKCISVVGDKEISELKRNDDVFVRMEGRKYGEFGEQRAISVYRVFLDWLEGENIQIPFAWHRIESVKTVRKDQYYLTAEDFESFVEKIPTTNFYGLRNRVLYEFLFSTGCRIGEALAIDVKDIDFEKREVFVHTEKKGSGTTVFISDRMMGWLQVYLNRKPECEALFVNVINGDPKRMNQISVFKNNMKYRKAFGIIKQLNHMSFRRGFGSNLLENSANIKEIQTLMRHKTPTTTIRSYLYIDKQKAKAAHNRVFSQAPKTEMVEIVNSMLGGKN